MKENQSINPGELFNPQDPCPHPEFYEVKGKKLTPREIIELLAPHLKDERVEKLKRAISHRTYNVVPVLENIYDEGNINAVVRSSESFGLQSYHVIRSERTKAHNRVARGAEKWTDAWVWKQGPECFKALKAAGYSIATTHLSQKAMEVSALPVVGKKWAVVLGNEHDGVSQTALEYSDANILIPTVGFTQSFNISVAGSLCFYQLFQSRVNALGKQGDFDEAMQTRLLASFIYRSLDSAEQILDRKI